MEREKSRDDFLPCEANVKVERSQRSSSVSDVQGLVKQALSESPSHKPASFDINAPISPDLAWPSVDMSSLVPSVDASAVLPDQRLPKVSESQPPKEGTRLLDDYGPVTFFQMRRELNLGGPEHERAAATLWMQLPQAPESAVAESCGSAAIPQERSAVPTRSASHADAFVDVERNPGDHVPLSSVPDIASLGVEISSLTLDATLTWNEISMRPVADAIAECPQETTGTEDVAPGVSDAADDATESSVLNELVAPGDIASEWIPEDYHVIDGARASPRLKSASMTAVIPASAEAASRQHGSIHDPASRCPAKPLGDQVSSGRAENVVFITGTTVATF
jgi:hypothetical protein